MAKKPSLPAGLILRGDTYHMRFMFKGQLVAESTFTKDLREAERVLIKRKSELHQDLLIGGKRLTNFHEAVKRFIATRTTKGAKDNAQRMMPHFTKAIPNKSIKKVEMHEVENVVADLYDDYAESTVKLAKTYWNSFVNWCGENKYPICGKFKIGKNKFGRTRWLTPEEQVKLLDALKVRERYQGKRDFTDVATQENYDFTVMLLDTGLRYAEAAKLTWNQIDLEKMVMYVNRSKGGSSTTLALTNRLRDVLVRRRSIDEHNVFPGKATGENRASSWMGLAVKKAGISTAAGKVTPHVMRHTAAAMWIQNGLSLVEVQHLLGHQNIEMTARYAHFRKDSATDKAVAIFNKMHEQQNQDPGSNVVKLAA